MGETQTPHFYDFWIFGRVPEPQNQYYLSLETPGYPGPGLLSPWWWGGVGLVGTGWRKKGGKRREQKRRKKQTGNKGKHTKRMKT